MYTVLMQPQDLREFPLYFIKHKGYEISENDFYFPALSDSDQIEFREFAEFNCVEPLEFSFESGDIKEIDKHINKLTSELVNVEKYQTIRIIVQQDDDSLGIGEDGGILSHVLADYVINPNPNNKNIWNVEIDKTMQETNIYDILKNNNILKSINGNGNLYILKIDNELVWTIPIDFISQSNSIDYCYLFDVKNIGITHNPEGRYFDDSFYRSVSKTNFKKFISFGEWSYFSQFGKSKHKSTGEPIRICIFYINCLEDKLVNIENANQWLNKYGFYDVDFSI